MTVERGFFDLSFTFLPFFLSSFFFLCSCNPPFPSRSEAAPVDRCDSLVSPPHPASAFVTHALFNLMHSFSSARSPAGWSPPPIFPPPLLSFLSGRHGVWCFSAGARPPLLLSKTFCLSAVLVDSGGRVPSGQFFYAPFEDRLFALLRKVKCAVFWPLCIGDLLRCLFPTSRFWKPIPCAPGCFYPNVNQVESNSV